MRRVQTVFQRTSPLACGALWLCLSHCGGTEFKSGGPTNGAGGSGLGGSENGGGVPSGASAGSAGSTGGDLSDAGSAGTSGSAGVGGATPVACNCPTGQYCRDGSNDCFRCDELGRMRFAKPERLATLSDEGQGSRFPRIASTSTELLYRFEGVGLRFTTDSSTSPGSSVLATLPEDSGPLWLDQEITDVAQPLATFNFLFDRPDPDGGQRAIQTGKWMRGLQDVQPAPAPFNTGSGDFSVAVARRPTLDGIARAFWMTNRNSATMPVKPELVTALWVANAPLASVRLRIGKPDCLPNDAASAADPDLTPWVTADGKMLLFSTTRLDADCAVASQKKDIYTVLLQPASGQPPAGAAATPMSDVNSAEDDSDPSFSADLCDLYFASNRDGKYAIYRAHRH